MSSVERGRQIYQTGTSPSGRPIRAYFGKDLLEVPGESATCTSCHGYDGLGRSESGVLPSNITWRHLMKSYGHIHAGGRHHPAFSEESLISYLQDGIFPGGVQGDSAMPVYDMPAEDLHDLVAYCRGLGSALDPGLTEYALRIGIIVPQQSQAERSFSDARAAVSAYFDEINSKGGIYGRKLELVSVAAEGTAPAQGKGQGSDVELPEPFAVIEIDVPVDNLESASRVGSLQIPTMALFAPQVDTSQLNGRYMFSLHAGLDQQIQVLAAYAARDTFSEQGRVSLVYPYDSGFDGAVSAAEAIFRAQGRQTDRMGYAKGRFAASEVIQALDRKHYGAVLFLGGAGEAEAFFSAAASLQQVPSFFFIGQLVVRNLPLVPPRFRERSWYVFPSLPEDRKSWGAAEFAAAAPQFKQALTNPANRMTAYAAAKLLVEGLRRSGRDLSREKLVDTLEGLFEYDTGLTRSVTFGKNRRTGTSGAYIVKTGPSGGGNEVALSYREWVQLK